MNTPLNRRHFIGQVAQAGSVALFTGPLLGSFSAAETLTVNQVIERIVAEVPGGKIENSVDTLKSGSGDQPVTGIVTCMFATVKVIQAAIKNHANFIICHEPTFYNHTDDMSWVADNAVVKQKME